MSSKAVNHFGRFPR
ncbi:unnamed protein product, partial [Rotaria sp. Silwood2]